MATSYWDGIEAVASMDLRLLDTVATTIASAREEAQKQVAALYENHPRSGLGFPRVPNSLGQELTTLWMRVYRECFARLSDAAYDEVQTRVYKANAARAATVDILAQLKDRFPEYHPADDLA